MKDLLKFIVAGIVENSSGIKISQSSQNGIEILNLTVTPTDMGKIIGKNGQIIKAIRNLLRTAGLKQGKKIQMTLQEKQS